MIELFFSHTLLSKTTVLGDSNSVVQKRVNIKLHVGVMASPFPTTTQMLQATRITTMVLPNHARYANPVVTIGVLSLSRVSNSFSLGFDMSMYYISNEINSARNKATDYCLYPILFKGCYQPKLTLLETIAIGVGKSFGKFQNEIYMEENGGFTSEIVFSTSKIRIKKTFMVLDFTYNYSEQLNIIDFDKTTIAQLDPDAKGKFKYTYFRHLLGLGAAIKF
jgi:hypothetical protein